MVRLARSFTNNNTNSGGIGCLACRDSGLDMWSCGMWNVYRHRHLLLSLVHIITTVNYFLQILVPGYLALTKEDFSPLNKLILEMYKV